MAQGGPTEAAEAVLRAERSFAIALGGYSLEISGASLVTHERLPVSSFNYVNVSNVGAERLTAFFERTLDHYFQRALRPTIRVKSPAPIFLDTGLRRLGFRPAVFPIALMEARPRPRVGSLEGPFEVVQLSAGEPHRVVPFWEGELDRAELGRATDVLVFHPNPEETLIPLVARRDGSDVSSGFLYAEGRYAGIHGIATRPEARGEGAASAIIRHALGELRTRKVPAVGMVAHHPRIKARLASLGFRNVGSLIEYQLPSDAELAMPPLGSPSPPRWRPPRGSGSRVRGREGESGGSP